MPIIKTISDLNKIVEQKIRQALDLTQKEINLALQMSIDRYYSDYSPKIYERTYTLEDSLITPIIEKSGNSYVCKVGFHDDYLRYKYAGSPNWEYNLPATGKDILEWNNEDGSHGGTIEGNVKIWDDAIQYLGGYDGILNIMIRNMKKAGLPIK